MTALRFLYGVTLRRERFVERLPMPRKEHYLPVIFSPAAVLRFLEAASSYSNRVIFSTMYGTGMRVSEALHLRMRHIDSQRMMIRIEQSKGNRDRDVPLSPKPLELLRTYCSVR
jgi:integrase/recombinase XerD